MQIHEREQQENCGRYSVKTIDNYQLATWEKLGKQMIWSQLDFVHGMKVLDFGSGEGVTADYLSEDNEVVAVEPSEEMVRDGKKRISSVDGAALSEDEVERSAGFTQLIGSLDVLNKMESETFDLILCHNVLEYADEREQIVREFYRLLRPGGKLSVIKHNRAGRVMQMAVLLNNFEHAHELLDGKDCTASKFGAIRYYEDEDIQKWCEDFQLVSVRGMRTFWDLQQNQEIQTDSQWQEEMLALEMRVTDMEAYKAVAFFHHLMLEKR